jgi:histone H3/H4
MVAPRKPDGDYSEKEAQRRFEQAVDAALHTPPMHRMAKKPATKRVANPRKAKRKDD